MRKIYFYLLIVIIILLFIIFSVFDNNSNNITHIKFSSWGSQSETTILKNLIKEFEINHPNIKVDFIHIPQNYFQKIHLLFASNLESDVIFLNNQYIKLYQKADLLEDLTNYNWDKNIFFKEALDCFNINGRIYAIPRDISNLVIYYNKEIFNENKIDPEEIKTINNLKDISKKLTNKNHFGINYEENSLYWLYYLASEGGGILSDDGAKYILNDKKSINALKLYKSMLKEDKSLPSKSQIGSMTTAQMFINGKLAMYLGGRWMVPKFRETISFNWDVLPFPSSIENKIYLDSSGWAISKKSKHKKEAFEFIKFLASDNSINKITESGLIVPALKESAEKLIKTENIPSHSKVFIDTIQLSKPTPVNENYNRINDIINEKIQLYLNGNYEFNDVFDDQTTKKIESLL